MSALTEKDPAIPQSINSSVRLPTSSEREINFYTCFLLIIAVSGSIGNLCVLHIYTKQLQKQATTYLTLFLAGADLAVCFLVIPVRLILRYVTFSVTASWVCRFVDWYSYGLVGFACLLLCLITIERYITVCHDQGVKFTKGRTLILSSMALVVSFTFSLIPAVRSSVAVQLNENITMTYFPGQCHMSQILTHPLRVHDDRYTAHIILFSTYVLLILINAVLYSLIFWKLRTTELTWKAWNSKITAVQPSVTTVQPSMSTVSGRVSSISRNVQHMTMESSESEIPRDPATVHRYSKILSTRLLLINLTYVVLWVPFYLTELEVIPYQVLVYNMFFVGNAINPVMYLITTSHYRLQMSMLCCQ